MSEEKTPVQKRKETQQKNQEIRDKALVDSAVAQATETIKEDVTKTAIEAATQAAAAAATEAITIVMSKYSQAIEAEEQQLGEEDARHITEAAKSIPVERQSELFVDDADGLKMEAFMNEIVTVRVHPIGADGEIPVISVCVNGQNQNIIRGIDQPIKRKYLEVLARTRTTNFEQRIKRDEPDNINMDPNTSLTYPFAVVTDRNPNGRAWLKTILEESM